MYLRHYNSFIIYVIYNDFLACWKAWIALLKHFLNLFFVKIQDLDFIMQNYEFGAISIINPTNC